MGVAEADTANANAPARPPTVSLERRFELPFVALLYASIMVTLPLEADSGLLAFLGALNHGASR
jgi:hypothetical protein